jgi:TrpR-related protein YerC/YecD
MSDGHHGDLVDVFDAILLLKNRDECVRFFKDLCTPQEFSVFIERWKVCQLLYEQKLSYREIHDQTGTSLATIGRVARFLRDEAHGGYRLILQRLHQGDSS